MALDDFKNFTLIILFLHYATMIALTESAVLVAASMVMSMGVIFNAYLQKQQFYPSVVYVTKSNGSMAVSIALFVFVLFFNFLICLPTDYLHPRIDHCALTGQVGSKDIFWATANHRIGGKSFKCNFPSLASNFVFIL